MKKFLKAIKQMITAWTESDPLTTGAALSFYLLFSLPTALIIAITIAGFMVSPGLVENRLVNELSVLFGRDIAQAVRILIDQSRTSSTGIIASIAGIIAVIWGSLGAFGQLQISLKKIWNIPADRKSKWTTMVKEKIAAFLMVIMLGFLLAASFLASTVLSVFGTVLVRYAPNIGPYLDLANLILSIVVIIFMFVLLYMSMPNLKVKWFAAIVGGIITAFFFMAGKILLTLYLNSSLVSSGYGAVSVFTVLLLWAYVSAQIFLFGAAVTHVIDEKLKTN
jgi:membrane protein